MGSNPPRYRSREKPYRKPRLPTGPDDGAYLIEVYKSTTDTKPKQHFFPEFEKAQDFMDVQKAETLMRVYRFSGWELRREVGRWYV